MVVTHDCNDLRYQTECIGSDNNREPKGQRDAVEADMIAVEEERLQHRRDPLSIHTVYLHFEFTDPLLELVDLSLIGTTPRGRH